MWPSSSVGPMGWIPSSSKLRMSASACPTLTLPHAMVRVLLIEQLYRAWSVNAGHPLPPRINKSAVRLPPLGFII